MGRPGTILLQLKLSERGVIGFVDLARWERTGAPPPVRDFPRVPLQSIAWLQRDLRTCFQPFDCCSDLPCPIVYIVCAIVPVWYLTGARSLFGFKVRSGL